jgi:hypothetical protein
VLDSFIEIFIKQGWFVAAFEVALLSLALYAIRELFKNLNDLHKQHTNDIKEIGERAIESNEAATRALDAITRAVETNGEVSKSHNETINALRNSLEAQSRSVIEALSGIGRRPGR